MHGNPHALPGGSFIGGHRSQARPGRLRTRMLDWLMGICRMKGPYNCGATVSVLQLQETGPPRPCVLPTWKRRQLEALEYWLLSCHCSLIPAGSESALLLDPSVPRAKIGFQHLQPNIF
jgi:hypothetical protein